MRGYKKENLISSPLLLAIPSNYEMTEWENVRNSFIDTDSIVKLKIDLISSNATPWPFASIDVDGAQGGLRVDNPWFYDFALLVLPSSSKREVGGTGNKCYLKW